MELLALNVNIAGEDVIKKYIFDKRCFIVFIIVETLDIIKGNCKYHSEFIRHNILAFNEYDVFGVRIQRHRAVCITGIYDRFCGVYHFLLYSLSCFAYFHKVAASDNSAVFIYNTDGTADSVFHLVNNALKKSS